MISPEAKIRAEQHLTRVESEIAEISANANNQAAKEYLEHIKEHRELWMRFLGRD